MKNTVVWQDIVKIKDDYFLEAHEVSFEDGRLNEIEFKGGEKEILEKIEKCEEEFEDFISDPLYDCSKFFEAIQKKYSLTDDEMEEVETYLFDDIDLSEDVCKKYDIALLGGYINGINI